nr:reverse transcriptase domain-containing protein [Tanacetum cinerariifolium]
MELMFDNSGCTVNKRVRYAASCFVNKALTWWNTQVQARGREATIANQEVHPWVGILNLWYASGDPANYYSKRYLDGWNTH